MTTTKTGMTLAFIGGEVAMRWNDKTGANFTVHGWDIFVPSHNRWDCWATKHGTLGKTYKTFARIDLRTDTHDQNEPHLEAAARAAAEM